jgi:hypothetical protein
VHALDTLAFQALFDQPLTNGAEDVGTEYTGESIRHLSMLITDKLKNCAAANRDLGLNGEHR